VEDANPKPKKIKPFYTIRDVIKQKYSDRIEEEISEERGDNQYIASYQRAVTKVHENMNDDDLEEAENMLELWNKEGAPPEIQLK
jgi:hypothetical protein